MSKVSDKNCVAKSNEKETLNENQENYINVQLVRHLTSEGLIVPITRKFITLKDNAKKVDFVIKLLGLVQFFPKFVKDDKDNEKSLNFRKEGNDKFKLKKYKDALELYTKSVLFAESCSAHLGLAYANRSAVLFEKGLYRECLMDIERALENNYPNNLRAKLLSRKENATKALDSQIFNLNYATPVPIIPKENQNPLIQCATNAIKLEYSCQLGRHIVATRDIKPGEIIVIEEPYSQVLLELYDHCHHCLKMCYNLIPCSKCTHTLFCSEQCQKSSYSYHKYECPIIATTKNLHLDQIKLLPLRIALLVSKSFSKSDNELKHDEVYRSDRYKEIHNLIGNSEKRSVSDMFDRTVTASIIFYLIKNHTDFFEDSETIPNLEDTFKELVLLHLQTGACNFHEIAENKNIRRGGSVEYLMEIGTGAYSFLSMFNHSCCPNIGTHCYGAVTVARTVESIKKGEQCFYTYGPHYAQKDRCERKENLARRYFFDCQCLACTGDFPEYRLLPHLPNAPGISSDDLLTLKIDDLNKIEDLYNKITQKIISVENLKPNKNLADLQEVLKQCFYSLSNIDTPF